MSGLFMTDIMELVTLWEYIYHEYLIILKGVIYRNHLLLVFFFFCVFGQKSTGQCITSADYSTTNNFCDLDSLYLTAHPLNGVGPYTFLWANGQTAQTISIPLAYGDYLVTITDDLGCSIVINCHIKPFPEVLFYPFNQNACEGDTVTLWLDWFRDSIPGATYLWSTGATTPTIQLTDDLVWSVTVTDPATGCSFIIPPGLFDFHPTPYPTIEGPDVLCTGQSATLSVTGGPFGSIYWFPQQVYAPTIEINAPGTYYVYAWSVEVGYCFHTDSIVILPGDILPPVLIGPPELCTGQTGSISITNAAFYNGFSWSNGQTTSSISINQPGIYTVTVTNSGGCTATGTYTVQTGAGAALTTAVTPTTCGQNNGSINLSNSPPASYTFLWSNGSISEDLNNIAAGVYTVTVTSTNGCTSSATVVVPDNPIVVTITENITPVTSCISNNGAIDISIMPSGTYAYLWSNGATSEDLTSLAPGNYSVTVTQGTNCITTENYVVSNLTNAPGIQSISSPATCGESNGSVDVQITNGTAPFTFLWSNGNITSSIQNVPSNTYSVTVTGADGCTSSTVINLPGTSIPIIVTDVITPNTSCLNSNGGIDITVSPTGAYTFLWSNGATTEDLINLTAGIFDVTITLGINCVQTASFIVDNQSIPFSVNGVLSPNTSCSNPNGSINLNINPSGNYTFLWDTGSTNEDLVNLNAGNYVVSITNPDGCIITSAFHIDDLITPVDITSFTSANTSCQGPNGSIDITVSPVGTYSYVWSTGSTAEDLLNLSPGTYSVTITSANGCTVDSMFIIDNLSATFVLTALPVSNTSCINPNGSLDLSITPPGTYSFLWSNGAMTEDIQFLTPGVYYVTVSDANQCSSSGNYMIDDHTIYPAVSGQTTSASCGAGNGTIDLTTTPSSNTVFWSTGSSTEDLLNISAGMYTVTITSTSGCIVTDTFVVDNLNSNFSVSAVPIDNTSCIQGNGSLDLTVIPAGSYIFQWSTGATTEDLQNLSAGQYQVTVSDILNCISALTFTIIDSSFVPVISPTITPSLCNLSNGSISLQITPSSGNSFLWSNGAVTKDLQNISAGNYAVTITNGNGCDTSASFVVLNNSSSFSISGTVVDHTSCVSPNGSIDLTITPAGNYLYTWSNGSAGSLITDLSAGIYTVTVNDQSNCSSSQTFTIGDSTSYPTITEIIIPAKCGQNNGRIDITLSSTGNNTFLWSNGSNQEDLSNIPSGVYTVTVWDTNGCSVSGQFTIPNHNSIFSIGSIIKDKTSCITSNGSIDLTITPAGQYAFIWSNGALTEDLIDVPSGIYQVTVYDANQCSSSEMFAIESTTTLPFISSVLNPSSCGESNGSIDLTLTPPNGHQFQWSTGDTSEDLTQLSEGIYAVTITDMNGCSATSSFTLAGSNPVAVTIDADLIGVQDSMVYCSLQLNIPLSMLDSISWAPENMFSCHERICLEQNFVLTQPVEIMVMVMDTNGCMGFASLSLDVEKEFHVYIPNVFSPNGDGPNDMFTVYGNKEVEEVEELLIFDRWGNCVFSNQSFPPNQPNYGWNGVFKDKEMNPDVFAYWARVRFSNGEEHDYKGDVTLIR